MINHLKFNTNKLERPVPIMTLNLTVLNLTFELVSVNYNDYV
jgi:hypothetical protein